MTAQLRQHKKQTEGFTMLDFIRRWLFNRSRFIFHYWNGSRTVKADPLVVWRTLQQTEDYSEDDFRLLKVDALRQELTSKIAGIVRQVFSIKLPDEGGLTELECLDLIRRFIEYAGFQKKSGSPTPSLPQSTADIYQGSTVEANTSEPSDCTSTSTESELSSPSQLLTE